MSSSDKAKLIDSIQGHLRKSNWKAAVADMEKLFAMNPDPIVRVRIGDAYQKLNQKLDAVKEYVFAADLFAQTGAVVKALAQYKLALRLDPTYRAAQEKLLSLHSSTIVKENKAEPVEAEKKKPASSVIPLFSSLSQDEFDDFTKMMIVHTLPAGSIIVRQSDTGKSVYVIASGSVKIHTKLLSGERVDLAVLQPSDFFGEIAFLTGQPRTATVETAEETCILEVTEENIRDLVTRRPHVREVLQKYSESRLKGTIEKVIGKSVEE